MIKGVELFAVRHAIYTPETGRDGYIDDTEIPKIEELADTLSTMLDRQGHFTVASSPKKRAYQTAQELIGSVSLLYTDQSRAIIESGLDEDALKWDASGYDRSWRLLGMMNKLGKQAAQAAAHSERIPALIVVTHEPVIRALPYFRDNPNLDHLAINHYSSR